MQNNSDNANGIKQGRIMSLDILRGFDLMMLVGLQPVMRQFLLTLNNETLNNTLLRQLDHVAWEGFSAWDLVMPLFLFMSGVTMPFSLPKYRNRAGDAAVWRRIIKRFALLFLLGMVVQGNLLGLDADRIYIYSNTLQAIAVGYLLAAPLVLYTKLPTQIASIAILLAIYTIPMTLFGDSTPQGNFAAEVDKMILGRFRDGSYMDENGIWQFASWYDYTWIWSSLTFCCTVAMGCIAGRIIKNGNDSRGRTTLLLLAIGVSLIIAGEIWDILQPMVKRIWNGSMTLYSGGWCYTLLAVFYWWIDVKGHRQGLQWLQFYGCNAITAYLLGEVINFRCIATSLLHGTEHLIGEWYPVLITAGNSLILFGILCLLYKRGIFLKV